MNRLSLKRWLSGMVLLWCAFAVTAATMTTEQTVVGHAPEVTGVTFDKQTPSAGVTVQATAVATDADGDTPVTLNYQWLRDGQDISGATEVSYSLTTEDEGHAIAVGVTPQTDGQTTDPAVGSEFISSKIWVFPVSEANSILSVSPDNPVAHSPVTVMLVLKNTQQQGLTGLTGLTLTGTGAVPAPALTEDKMVKGTYTASFTPADVAPLTLGVGGLTGFTKTVVVTAAAATATGSERLVKPADLTVALGDTVTAPVIAAKHGGALSYSSDKPAVVAVDTTGKLTLVATGTATITVTESAAGGYAEQSVTYTVTVMPPLMPHTPVTGVVGQSGLDVKVSGGGWGGITYRSEDTAKVTVDTNGNLTLKAPGKVIVTVTQAAYGNIAEQKVTTLVTVTPVLAATTDTTWADTSVVAGSAIKAFTPVTGAGGIGALSYSVAPALPQGLVLSGTTGEITGTPATPQAQTVYTVTVTDHASPSVVKTATFNLTVTRVATVSAVDSSLSVSSGVTAGLPLTITLLLRDTLHDSVPGKTGLTLTGTGEGADPTFTEDQSVKGTYTAQFTAQAGVVYTLGVGGLSGFTKTITVTGNKVVVHLAMTGTASYGIMKQSLDTLPPLVVANVPIKIEATNPELAASHGTVSWSTNTPGVSITQQGIMMFSKALKGGTAVVEAETSDETHVLKFTLAWNVQRAYAIDEVMDKKAVWYGTPNLIDLGREIGQWFATPFRVDTGCTMSTRMTVMMIGGPANEASRPSDSDEGVNRTFRWATLCRSLMYTPGIELLF